MSDELTEKERAALNALDLSEILGTPEERIRFALEKAVQYLRERNTSRSSEKMAWAEHARRVAEIERLRAIVDRQRNALLACHRWVCTKCDCKLDGGPEHDEAFLQLDTEKQIG